MNQQTDLSNAVVSGLHAAASAADRLLALRVNVQLAYSNGRRACLVIDKPPPFVRGVVKRQSPNGCGGVDRVRAASFHGVQLEWMEHVAAAPEVGHG